MKNIWLEIFIYREAKHGVNYESLFEFIRWLLLYISLPSSLLIAAFIIAPQYAYNSDKFELDTISQSTGLPSVCGSNVNELNDNSSVLLTKCCERYYNTYLDKRIKDNEWYNYMLDVIQGTVS